MVTLILSLLVSFYPAQYITKLYTEFLGRVPDQQGYKGYSDYFQQNGCNDFTLKVIGYQFLNSEEFAQLNYSGSARIIATFRALLNREPTVAEFEYFKGRDWKDSLFFIYGTDEFNKDMVKLVCSSKSEYNKARYGWRGVAASSGYIVIPESEFLELVKMTPKGQTLWLPARSAVFLTKSVDVYGIAIKTAGNPHEYLNMARLIRAKNFNGPGGCRQLKSTCGESLIRLHDSSTLENVWVDGNGQALEYNVWDINVQTLGSNVVVRGCRVDNSAGFSNIQAIPVGECRAICIDNNFILGYNSDGFANKKSSNPWVDGITSSCEGTLVHSNSIVDTSDVSIVIFAPREGMIQSSKVMGNVIHNAGNSSFAALNTDHIFVTYPADFSDTFFESNLIWTSDFVSIRTALSVGSGLWGQNGTGYGYGAQFLNNTTGTGFVQSQFGILLAGMRAATVLGNKLDIKLVDTRCGNLPANIFAADTETSAFNTNLDQNYRTIPKAPCFNIM